MTPILQALGVGNTALLYGLPTVVFAMSIFTFPFMVMNIGAALSNVDPTLEEAAAMFWGPTMADVRAGHPAADADRDRRGGIDGLRLEHRDLRRTDPPGFDQ